MDLKSHNVHISRDVVFFEEQFPYSHLSDSTGDSTFVVHECTVTNPVDPDFHFDPVVVDRNVVEPNGGESVNAKTNDVRVMRILLLRVAQVLIMLLIILVQLK